MNVNQVFKSSEQNEQFEKDYQAIFSKIENLIEKTNQKKLLFRDSRIFLDPFFITMLAIPVLLFIYSLILIGFKSFISNNLGLFYTITYSFLAIILSLTFIATRHFFKEIKKTKDIQKELIRKTSQQGLNDREISIELSHFDRAALKYADRRLKLLIENRSIVNTRLNNIIPLISIIIAAVSIYSSGISNLTISNIMLTSGFVLILLKGFTELLDDQSFYKRCSSIVEYAQVLAEENQEIEQEKIQKINPSNQNIMKSLRKYQMDKYSDFDYNS